MRLCFWCTRQMVDPHPLRKFCSAYCRMRSWIDLHAEKWRDGRRQYMLVYRRSGEPIVIREGRLARARVYKRQWDAA